MDTVNTVQTSALPAFDSNYLWLIHNSASAWVVDPGDAAVVQAALDEKNLTLKGILVTHHHADHVGGVLALKKRYPQARVIGPKKENITGLEQDAVDGAHYTLDGLGFDAQCMAVPGHTAGHVAYYLAACPELGGIPRLFCGDTLFAAGCGRLFEGTPAQMLASLAQITALPAATLAYCAHEYTQSNLVFAASADPDNEAVHARLAQCMALRDAQLATVPFVLGEELSSNPFLRCHTAGVRAAVSAQSGQVLNDTLAVFTALRAWKNVF